MPYDLPYAEAIYQEPVWVMVFESFWGVGDPKKWQNLGARLTGSWVESRNSRMQPRLDIGLFFSKPIQFWEVRHNRPRFVCELYYILWHFYICRQRCRYYVRHGYKIQKTASGDGTFEGDARCHRIQQPFECCSEKLGFAQMWVLLVAFK